MDAVNIRELKRNPSAAVRKTANGPVLVMRGNEPAALLVGLDLSEDTANSTRLALAASLFTGGTLSLGRAADLAALSVSAFISHLGDLGIPIAEADEDDATADMASLDAWLASS